MRGSKPHIENKSCGLSFKKTLTKVSSHSMDHGERAWQTVLYIPEDHSSEVDIVFDETHATIPRPIALVVVSMTLFVGSRLALR